MTADTSVESCMRNVAAGQPATDRVAAIREFLQRGANAFETVIPATDRPIVLDLSAGSRLGGEPLKGIDVDRFAALVERSMREAGTSIAYGRYAEPRDLYHTELFSSDVTGRAERRDVHLGIDVFCDAGTSVHTPLDGTVEIVANNKADLDYGPLLVLRHASANGTPFYLLHGHLALHSISSRRAGDRMAAGEKIAEVGAPPENGNWPPHLHLQVVTNLLGLGADFPGVACRSQLAMWLQLSPSPAAFFPDCAAADLNHALGDAA
ncbi:MAG: peptidoglycan DD-metalloendopeptidase family protein [Gammaproteobacteria bacterium]|nr:peptidoglycan DD-metalloendopeptidase family protein [Gammaproteobacteria bacterium]